MRLGKVHAGQQNVKSSSLLHPWIGSVMGVLLLHRDMMGAF
jgi:hypothetical protein